MFHAISPAIQAQMVRLEQIDAQDRRYQEISFCFLDAETDSSASVMSWLCRT